MWKAGGATSPRAACGGKIYSRTTATESIADRRGDWGRDLALYVARTRSGRTLAELGTLSGMSKHGVSKAVQRMSVRLSEGKKLNRFLRKVLLALDEKE